MDYKYHLEHFLSLRPASITMQQIEDILQKDHGISRSTFLRDRSITKNSDKSIPSDRLDIYAALLNVSVDDLKNYTVKVKPLQDRKPSELMKKVIKRTGMRKKQ